MADGHHTRRALPVYRPELQFSDAALCNECGGNCCKRMPGSTHPAEWGETDDEKIANLADAFASGLWAIDWWEGDPRSDDADFDTDAECVNGYFVRPGIVGHSAHVFGLRHAAWSGVCRMLQPTGCELRHDMRPIECRGLEPQPVEIRKVRGCGTDATLDTGKRANASAWMDFHHVILAAEARATARGIGGRHV